MTKLIKTRVLAALLAGFSAPSMADIAFGLGYQEGDKLSSQYVDLMFRGDLFEIGGEYQNRKRDDQLEDYDQDAISEGMAFLKVGAGYSFPLKRITVRPYYNLASVALSSATRLMTRPTLTQPISTPSVYRLNGSLQS